VPGYEASAVNGIGAPAGTPALIIDRLNKEINAGLAVPKLRARLIDMGATILSVAHAFSRPDRCPFDLLAAHRLVTRVRDRAGDQFALGLAMIRARVVMG
jgi:Tripartite tricarboxylate transporter family receptor